MNNLKNQPNVKFSTSFDDKMSCAIGTFEVEGVDVSGTWKLFDGQT